MKAKTCLATMTNIPLTPWPPRRLIGTAIRHIYFFPVDEDIVPDLSSSEGRLFVPSTPRAIGPISISSGESERKESMNTEASLLGSNYDSIFLGALSIWGKTPNSRTFDDGIEGEARGETTDLAERWREE